MNKKFSTLVAALLVSGGSLVVASQYMGSPLMSSPLAKAAAANLRAGETPQYTYTFSLKTAENTYAAAENETLNWYASGSAAGFTLQTKAAGQGPSTLGEVTGDANVQLLNTNDDVEGTDLTFTYVENHLETANGRVLVIQKDGGKALQVINKTAVDLSKVNYATLYAGSQRATTVAFSANDVYTIGSEVLNANAVANNAVAASLTAGAAPAMENSTSLYTTGGPDHMPTELTGATKAELVTKGAIKVLKLTSAKGTSLYLHVNNTGAVSFTESDDYNADGAYSAVTLSSNNNYAVKLGEKYLRNDDFAQTDAYDAEKGVYLWSNGAVVSDLSTIDDDLYLLAITSNASQFATTTGSAALVDLTIAAGAVDQGALAAYTAAAINQFTVTADDETFTLSNGYDYLSNDENTAAVESGDTKVGQFSLSAVDGAVMLGGKYLANNTNIGLMAAPTQEQKLYLYKVMGGSIENQKPVTALADIDENATYALAPSTTTVADLTDTQVRVVVATEKAEEAAPVTPETPDPVLPALGEPKVLVDGASYSIKDADQNAYFGTPVYDAETESYGFVKLEASNLEGDDNLEGLWRVTEAKWNKNGVATHYALSSREQPKMTLAFDVKLKNRDAVAAGGDAVAQWEISYNPEGAYNVFFIDNKGHLTFAAEESVKVKSYTCVNKKTYSLVYNETAGNWEVVEYATDNANNTLEIEGTEKVNVSGGNVADQVEWLNVKAGDGKGFALSYVANDKTQTLEDNVLTEGVTAVQGPDLSAVTGKNLSDKIFFKISGDYKYNGDASTEKKQKAQLEAFRASKFVAVDTVLYSKQIADADNYYYLVKVSGADMISKKGYYVNDQTNLNELLDKTGNYVGVTRRIENAEFTVKHSKGSTIVDPVYIAAKSARFPVAYNEKGLINADDADAADGHYEKPVYIAVKNYNKKNYVGAVDDKKALSYFFVTKNNDVDFTKVNGIVNIISRNYKTDGQVYANLDAAYQDEDYAVNAGETLGLVLAKYVALDKPEGQFLVTGGDYDKYGQIQRFTFTNRESGEVWEDVALKATDEANIYAVVGTNDTIEVKAANAGDEFVGYANYKKSVLDNTEYVLKVVSNAAGIQDIYIAEDHNKDHSLGLNADTLESANFKLIKFEAAKSTAKAFGDTIYVSDFSYSYVNSKKEYDVKDDRVVAFTYAIYNADNMEFLAANTEKGSTKAQYLYCNPDLKYNPQTGANAQQAQRFVIKEKNNGAIQLIPVDQNGEFDDDDNWTNIFTQANEVPVTLKASNGQYNYTDAVAESKAYAGISDNKLFAQADIYKIADNDLFRIVEVGAPMYRKLDGEVYDKVRIYKEGMQNVALFAQGTDATILSGKNFLGMEHKADADLNKTMFSFMVDTAFVDREDNYKPQYLLAIDTEIVPEATYCEKHGLNPDCSHTTKKIGYAKGSYLVNLVDSAAAWTASKAHNNPYLYDNYARLGFVKATHIGDALAIERGKAVSADTLDLTGMTKASFALRIVDQDSKSFVMETKGGWIKWLNGVPVVVPTLAQAEVLNIEKTDENATANESIAAEGVQVISGKGAITVQGAAGKVVTVANILGQTIANQVAASDNETIAAPAGVMVVTVDGEATKVVVK